MLREVYAREIEKVVEDLCVQANTVLREDMFEALREASMKEGNTSSSKKMLDIIIENAKIARRDNMPLCQDTGLVTVFIEIGSEVFIKDGYSIDAVNSGVKKAYDKHYLRKSIVEDPICRKNTGTNTPAVVHTDIVEGNKINICVMPKGFGSENKSRVVMLNPTCKKEEIVNFCVKVVKDAGPDACPPYVLGVGLGGSMESCAYLAKKALLRPITTSNKKSYIAEIENEIKEKANALEIGVMGLGGEFTVLGVNVKEAPTHIAGCPVAVNIACHSLRSASAEI